MRVVDEDDDVDVDSKKFWQKDHQGDKGIKNRPKGPVFRFGSEVRVGGPGVFNEGDSGGDD